jgi:hypothetical protein
MPEPDFCAEAVIEDYTDLKVQVIDNGNDKIIIKGMVMGKNSRQITLSCDKFIPKLEDSKVLVAGSGSCVYLKSLQVK